MDLYSQLNPDPISLNDFGVNLQKRTEEENLSYIDESKKDEKKNEKQEDEPKTDEPKNDESKPDETQEGMTNQNEQQIKTTFYITYAFLMTPATITFIEAMRTPDIKIRNIMNLETCISVVAAYFYGNFVSEMGTDNTPINYEKINMTRYTDWAITTPIMLLVLCLAFLYNTKGGPLPISKFVNVLLLNYGMLGVGYLGEIGTWTKMFANTIGFGFFIALYGYIHKHFVKNVFDNKMLFWVFVTLWSFYGVFYMMGDITKNIGYNVLDLLSKCFVGIFFWAYFTKVFSLA
jgi:bacteriorhodopsin